MKKRALNPIHIKYGADFEPGRASCTVHVQTIWAKRVGTPNNNPLLVKFMLLCS